MTPRFPVITVADLEKCPLCPFDPPDGDYFLDQDLINGCLWTYEDANFKMQLQLTALATGCYIFRPPAAGWYYFLGQEGPCESLIHNDHVECGGLVAAKNGTVTVSW